MEALFTQGTIAQDGRASYTEIAVSPRIEADCAIVGSGCSTVENGDTADVMGSSRSAHYSAFQKERLGWLNSGNGATITSVEADGSYVLQPYESPGPGAKALKILKSTDPVSGARSWYYIESRQALGFDSFLAKTSNNLQSGVVMHVGTEGSGNSDFLLDMTPSTFTLYSGYDFALQPGQSFVDPDTGLTIIPVAVDASGASVLVRFQGASAGGGSANGVPSAGSTSPARTQTVSVTGER
jgi:hypothetical protein